MCVRVGLNKNLSFRNIMSKGSYNDGMLTIKNLSFNVYRKVKIQDLKYVRTCILGTSDRGFGCMVSGRSTETDRSTVISVTGAVTCGGRGLRVRQDRPNVGRRYGPREKNGGFLAVLIGTQYFSIQTCAQCARSCGSLVWRARLRGHTRVHCVFNLQVLEVHRGWNKRSEVFILQSYRPPFFCLLHPLSLVTSLGGDSSAIMGVFCYILFYSKI